MEFTIDIICVAATEKQPFFFKRSSVNGVRPLLSVYLNEEIAWSFPSNIQMVMQVVLASGN